MTPGEEGQILSEIRALREDLHEVKADVKEVKAEARATNGNVRALQIWRAAVEARFSMLGSGGKWVSTIVASVVTGTVTAVIVAAVVSH